MKQPKHQLTVCALVLFGVLTTASAAERMKVKIIDRQSNETQYTYVVPGHSSSNSRTDVNCYGGGANVNCSGSTRTTGTSSPARIRSYELRGATFTLLLPDDRVVLVNCDRKLNMGWGMNTFRSCRMPLKDEIQVEFKGDKAKLMWPVSIDGKKLQSETYKILAVFDE